MEDQAGIVRHWKDKAKMLTELEKHLSRKQIELATERKMFAELKKKFVSNQNLEVIWLSLHAPLIEGRTGMLCCKS